jgi:hypothetical protein
MALVITRKIRTVFSVVLVVLVLGTSGFLIWFVNRPDEFSPVDSEAATGYDSLCPTIGATYAPVVLNVDKSVCDPNFKDQVACPNSRTVKVDVPYEGLYSVKGVILREYPEIAGQCQKYETLFLKINETNGRIAPDNNNCNLNALCQELSPKDSLFKLSKGSNSVVIQKAKSESVSAPDYPNSVHVYNLVFYLENICEGGSWLEDPSGTHSYGTLERPITINTTDADGLGAVTVKINEESIPECGPAVGVSCYSKEDNDININIDAGQQNIAPGEYTLAVAWLDGLGIGGDNCKLSSSFTVSDETIDPACSARAKQYPYDATGWTPEEVGFCKVGSTATPSFQELTDSFPEPGEIVTWVCSNDQGSVDCEASRANINDASCGTLATNYSSGTQTWPQGTFCAVGQAEPVSPSFPSLGGQSTWVCRNDTKTVSCVATRDNVSSGPVVPQTGIFDTVLGRVSIGVSFIFLGGLVSQYSRINYFFNSVSQERDRKRMFRRRTRLEDRFRNK